MRVSDRIKELSRPTGEEDVLAVRYPKPRITVPVKQALAACVAVFVLLGAWVLGRGDPPQEDGVAELSWEQVANPTEVQGVVVVSVVGEVENPGLVSLNEGSRIADALQVARPLPHADLIALNQAQVLVDGTQIHVQAIGSTPGGVAPGAPPGAVPGAVGAAAGGSGVISLNAASAQELTALPGVGDATAAAIVAHREANGPFTSVEQLMDVKGIGPAKFEAMRAQVGL